MARPTLPATGSTAWAPGLNAAIFDVSDRADIAFDPKFGGYYLDSPRYTGTDDQRLTAAMTDQQNNLGGTNMAPIILPSRPLSFNQPRTLYPGLKIIGPHASGQKNPELAGGNYVGPEVTLGGTINSGASSWWNGTGDQYDIYMGDFSVQGSQGSSIHQFLDQPSGTLYACAFHSLSFNFMRSVFGRSDRKCLMTQVAFTGNWTMNNAWDCQMMIGGSDCNIDWAMCNMGTSQSSAQTGNLTRYFMKIDTWEGTIAGKTYITAANGWRGLLISGNSAVDIWDGVFEGFKPTRVNGLLAGPAPGSVVKITGGCVTMHGTKMGQGMDNPDPSENGLLEVNGGEVSLFGGNFYGNNMATANAINHTAGRLTVLGATRRASMTNRPRIATTATNNAGSYSFYCPDNSLTVV